MLVVCVYMLTRFSWYFALLTFCTIVLYFVYTLVTTEWRNKYRKEMNDVGSVRFLAAANQPFVASQADNEQNQRSVDALLNFETVRAVAAQSLARCKRWRLPGR